MEEQNLSAEKNLSEKVKLVLLEQIYNIKSDLNNDNAKFDSFPSENCWIVRKSPNIDE